MPSGYLASRAADSIAHAAVVLRLSVTWGIWNSLANLVANLIKCCDKTFHTAAGKGKAFQMQRDTRDSVAEACRAVCVQNMVLCEAQAMEYVQQNSFTHGHFTKDASR